VAQAEHHVADTECSGQGPHSAYQELTVLRRHTNLEVHQYQSTSEEEALQEKGGA
jgi:hypothetical protein